MGETKDPSDLPTSEGSRLQILESILSLDRALAALPHCDPIQAIVEAATIHLKQAFHLQAVAFFLVNPKDFNYELALADPPEEQSALVSEVDRAIEDGIFGWALRRNQALVQVARDARQFVLHPLIAPHSTVGMLAAFAPADVSASPSALTLLSVVLSRVALCVENRALRADLRAHNQQLEQTVVQRTKEAVNAMHAAQAANRAKSEFLANMSHEIRTPLGAVTDLTELLLQSDLTPSQKLYAETARRSAETLLTVVNDILDFSKIEAGRLAIESVDFDLRDLIERLLAMMRPRVDAKRLQLVTVVSPEIPCALRGDPGRLRQVLVNLVGNAIKFTTEGSVRVRVTFESKTAERVRLRFHVDDTGVGIPAAVQSRLFEKFSQADSSTTRRFGGTGLGLAISKQLVELMGGEIGVSSQESVGSEFWFSVWLDRQLAGDRPTRSSSSAETTKSDLAAIAPAPGLRALLAEDDAANQMVMRGVFDRWGLALDVACNGRQAVDRLSHTRYDLVLIDAEMAETDALDATRAIRTLVGSATSPRVPIIALTAHATESDRLRCLGAGMTDVLSKPVDPRALAQAIERWTAKRRAEDKSGGETAEAAADTTSAVDPAVFDQTRLLARLADDRAAAAAVARSFIEDAPKQMEALASLAKVGDAAGMARQARIIYCAADTVGGIALGPLALRLEQAGKAGDLASARALFVELQGGLDHLTPAMTASGILRDLG